MEIKNQKSEILAAKVVAFRVLGFDRESALEAMQELTRRKAAGDTFDFQTYINEKIAQQPERPQMPNVSKGIGNLFGLNLPNGK